MLMRAGACKKTYSKVVLSLEHKGTFYRLLLQTGYAQYNRYPICDIMDVLSTTIDTKRHSRSMVQQIPYIYEKVYE